jgi:hypothetical protein
VRFSGTQDDQPVRLFRRAGARWTGQVHEILAAPGPTGRLRNWLEHETLPDLSAFLAKMDRYTTLEAQARVIKGLAPRWHEAWIAPPIEVFRRLIWKQGAMDGPEGWAFCLLSGLSKWIVAGKHRRLWRAEGRRGEDCRFVRPRRTDLRLKAVDQEGSQTHRTDEARRGEREASASWSACGAYSWVF